MWATTLVLGMMAGLPGEVDRTAISPCDFQAWFAASARGRLRVPEAVEARASRFRYVFVGGFRSERMPGYFAQNAKELRKRGVPRKAIHFIYPNSSKSFDENIEEIQDQFAEVADAGPERLVVIAHSRGACDTLAFAVRNPSFVRDHVEALFLVQGPFGGSAFADYVMGEGTPMDRRMPPLLRVVAHLIGKAAKLFMDLGDHGGLAGMTRKASRAFWERTLAENADAIPIVGPKTFYIESVTYPKRLRLFLRATGRYLDTYYGPNDGIVAEADQSLPDLGTSLGVLDAGHPDLTLRFPFTRAKRRFRRALVQSIIMAVGRAEPGSVPDPEPVRPRRRSHRATIREASTR